MTGRHTQCSICEVGRVMEVEYSHFPDGRVRETIASCSNPDCFSNRPTGPILDTQRRAWAEVESIKRELRQRIARGEDY